MTITHINRCPFCGSDELDIEAAIALREVAIVCPKCRCTGPISGSAKDAVEVWNRAGQSMRDLIATIDLHTDCMTNQIDRGALDPWIEKCEKAL